LASDRRPAVIDAALSVAVRLSDAERVRAAFLAAAEQTRLPATIRWSPCDVAQGDAGLALMCAYVDRCFPDAGWDVVGHTYLTSAAHAAEARVPPPGLLSGLSGLGLVALLLARDGSRYQRLAATIDAALAPQALRLARATRARTRGLSASQFDLVSGLAGIGAYLLARREHPTSADALEGVLTALVELVGDRDDMVPPWFTPPELQADKTAARSYPHGSLNCGLAHGIPGPLALMALALSHGVAVDGLREAAQAAAAWILAHRSDDEWGINWPTMVRLPESQAQRDPPSRAAWCYGSPGVARALWLAGTALADSALTELAIEAMEAVYRRPVPARHIDSPTFCHGVAGLLHVTLRFAHDTGLPVFAQAAADLTDQLMAAYDPGSRLGFCSVEPGGNRVDQAGLLDGAPGVALVLLAAATDVEPTWDRLFLLA